jgi:glycosyltransferase involved in cell wall biosynthesis
MVESLELGDCVMSAGNIPHDNIYQILDRADAFVVPSYAETFEIPIVEAMQSELPIIAADLEFDHDVCGPAAIYFKHDSKEKLAAAILQVFKDHELYDRLKTQSKLRSKLYDGKKAVTGFISLLSD